MKYKTIRQEVLDAVFQARGLGLIHGTSGNIAMRDADEGVIAITPGGVSYDGMTAADISIVEVSSGEWIDGPYKPSSELPMHLEVLRRRPDIQATVHTHGIYGVLAAMQGGVEAVTPPHAEFVPVGIADFAVPGDPEGAVWVADALGDTGRSVILRNHGLFCCGATMQAAMDSAVYTEEMAQMNFEAKRAGVFQPLSEEHVRELKKILEHYHVEK